MDYAGTSWEGVVWRRPPGPRAGLLGDFGKAVAGADRRAMALAFLFVFPFFAALAVALAAPPVGAGSCSTTAVRPTAGVSANNPTAVGRNRCANAGGHRHWGWVELRKDVWGPGNKFVADNGRWSSKGFFVISASGWRGEGYYYSRSGVRWQDRDASTNVYWG